MDLTKMKCLHREEGEPPLKGEKLQEFAGYLNPNWDIIEDTRIQKQFSFNDYQGTMAFVNKVADLAEEQDHHPDMYVYYDEVKVEFWTHSVGGLSENDFIMAAKINEFS